MRRRLPFDHHDFYTCTLAFEIAVIQLCSLKAILLLNPLAYVLLPKQVKRFSDTAKWTYSVSRFLRLRFRFSPFRYSLPDSRCTTPYSKVVPSLFRQPVQHFA